MTCKLVFFEGVLYRVTMDAPCDVSFEVVDEAHHMLHVRLDPDAPTPICLVGVQWGPFPPVFLDIMMGGGESWLLGVETGYAEK
jgi:hypothetical protein